MVRQAHLGVRVSVALNLLQGVVQKGALGSCTSGQSQFLHGHNSDINLSSTVSGGRQGGLSVACMLQTVCPNGCFKTTPFWSTNIHLLQKCISKTAVPMSFAEHREQTASFSGQAYYMGDETSMLSSASRQGKADLLPT